MLMNKLERLSSSFDPYFNGSGEIISGRKDMEKQGNDSFDPYFNGSGEIMYKMGGTKSQYYMFRSLF